MSVILALVLSAACTPQPQTCESKLAQCQSQLAKANTCKPKKKAKPAPKPEKPCCGQSSTTNITSTSINNTININIAPAIEATTFRPELRAGIGLRGAIGLWSCQPHLFGLVGVRGRIPSLALGLELNTQFYWGHSFQVMLYPIQGPVSWHIDAGVLWFSHRALAAQDVPRNVDFLVGTGLEFIVVPHLSLTADWRMVAPNFVTMTKLATPDASGRHLNVGNVVGNAFLRSQLMLGLMIHSW